MRKKQIALLSCFLLLLLTGLAYAGEAPDYSSGQNWAYAPGDAGDQAVDVFFVAPTVFLGGEDRLNLSLEDTITLQNFRGAVNMEKGIYDREANFYAPYYRQAALYAYKLSPQEDSSNFAIAYQDVKAAFQYYLANYNQGRPIVLAGFSQGADMVLRLLKDMYRDKNLQDRLVAAYAIGWRVTPEELAMYPQLKMARSEWDTGVIISFNTEATYIKTSLLVPDRTLGINPLNWRTDGEYAAKALNKGTVFTGYDGEIKAEAPNLTGAYLDKERGTLKVPDVDPSLYPPGLEVFPPGVFHIYDYQFFYRNLQENVKTRIDAFMAARSLRKVS